MMAMTPRSNNSLIIRTHISSADVSDGYQQFRLNGMQPVLTVDSFVFDQTPTAGTVSIHTSPDEGLTWDDVPNGLDLDATRITESSRVKPAGRGLAGWIRFTFSGIEGAESFRAVISQGVS